MLHVSQLSYLQLSAFLLLREAPQQCCGLRSAAHPRSGAPRLLVVILLVFLLLRGSGEVFRGGTCPPSSCKVECVKNPDPLRCCLHHIDPQKKIAIPRSPQINDSPREEASAENLFEKKNMSAESVGAHCTQSHIKFF